MSAVTHTWLYLLKLSLCYCCHWSFFISMSVYIILLFVLWDPHFCPLHMICDAPVQVLLDHRLIDFFCFLASFIRDILMSDSQSGEQGNLYHPIGNVFIFHLLLLYLVTLQYFYAWLQTCLPFHPSWSLLNFTVISCK